MEPVCILALVSLCPELLSHSTTWPFCVATASREECCGEDHMYSIDMRYICVLILIKSLYSHMNINNSSHQKSGDART